MTEFDKLINALPSICSLMRELGVLTINEQDEILVTEPNLRELIKSGYFDGFNKRVEEYDGHEFVYFTVGSITIKGIALTGGKW